MAKIRFAAPTVGKNVRKRNSLSYVVGWMENGTTTLEKDLLVLNYKIRHMHVITIPTFPLPNRKQSTERACSVGHQELW